MTENAMHHQFLDIEIICLESELGKETPYSVKEKPWILFASQQQHTSETRPGIQPSYWSVDDIYSPKYVSFLISWQLLVDPIVSS